MVKRPLLLALLVIALTAGCAPTASQTPTPTPTAQMPPEVLDRIVTLESEVRVLKTQVETLSDSVRTERQPTDESWLPIDLTTAGIQEAAKFVMVAQLSVQQHLSGVKVMGVVINPTSIQFNSIEMELRIGSRAQSFNVFNVSAGGSEAFEAYLPDVSPASASIGWTKLKNITMTYRPK